MGLIAAETNGRSHDTEALYREHGVAVARFCHSLLRDRNEVEDATQQVFLSAHRALLNGAVPREPLPWLLTVARNECYARFRQRAATPIPTAETPEGATTDASVHVLRAGELASVWDEVGRMPPAQREAFLLREIRGLSYGQLADELSLSPPSVRSLLVRARTRLRQRLGEVAAGIGGVPWVQALIRLLAGGDGASPLPAAAKAAAVGVGALALAGGGSLMARHASRGPAHAAARHRAATRVHHPRPPAVAPVAPGKTGGSASSLERSHGGDGSGRRSSSAPSGSRDARDNVGTSSGDGSSGSGQDGSNDTTVAQPTSDGGDGGSSSSGSASGSSDGTSLSGSGSDSGSSTSGSSSGSDGGSTSTTTTATTSDSDAGSLGGSDGSGGGSTDSGSSDGHSG
jgi:RNA polymerase sigma-70 factor, ECF subfamily